MKNLKIYLISLTLISSLVACNDEWKDELYENLVSFKAPINSEGVYNVYMRYTQDGEINYDLPVIASGSKELGKDLSIRIAVDNDTLGILNQARFQYREDLYFKQLPEQFYDLQSPICLIPKGTHTANYKLKFRFANLDLVERWVLPLTIVDDPSYKANYRKGWRKALLQIKPFNNYSGNYSATAMNVYFDGESKSTVTSSRTAYVVDENSVFFYAGLIEESAVDRANYKIIMEFGEAVEQGDGTLRGTLTLKAVNPAIKLEVLNQPTYQIKRSADATLPYLVREYCTVNLEYKYNDITSIPTLPIRYKAQGTMTMERQRNTLIPDEDQAIQW